MSYEDHQKQLMRRQNEEIARKNSEGGGEAVVGILGLLWLMVIYLPFVIIAVAVGIYANKHWGFQTFPAFITAVLVAFAAYFLINLIESFSDGLKEEGNYWYIPIKLFVLVTVTGAPFVLGYQLGASAVDSNHPWQRMLAGGFVGLLLAGPAYAQVILSNKEGY
ncbi:hypothetical protein ACFQUU_06135 [Herbaspirillum sp. GCM10030257]|uniref:hypothetical protein n=1 Tax=Herbaspirillum sp. GCM10030257 TaxID=3273393 RepID=UPI003614DC39